MPREQAAVTGRLFPYDSYKEKTTYDVAAIRLRAVSEEGSTLSYCNEPLTLTVKGTAFDHRIFDDQLTGRYGRHEVLN